MHVITRTVNMSLKRTHSCPQQQTSIACHCLSIAMRVSLDANARLLNSLVARD